MEEVLDIKKGLSRAAANVAQIAVTAAAAQHNVAALLEERLLDEVLFIDNTADEGGGAGVPSGHHSGILGTLMQRMLSCHKS